MRANRSTTPTMVLDWWLKASILILHHQGCTKYPPLVYHGMHLHQSCVCISTRAGTSLWWSEKAFAWSKLSAVHCPARWLIQIIVGLNEFQGHLSGDSGASKANIDWSDNLWLRRVRNKVLKSKLCTVILLWSCVTTRICDATTEFATDGVCNCHLVTA